MTRSLFADASYLPRGIFAIACLALILTAFFDAKFPFEIQGQQIVKESFVGSSGSTETTSPASKADIFLQLAASVGQTAPAKRLVDYKLKNDPASQQRYYAIVDFNQPSTSKRLYVFDTVEKKVESYYVAHGRGSEGSAGSNIPAIFSNQNGSNSSSLGIYRTLDEYNGHHGRSLRLAGLEPTNSNALDRAVVMHTADYVSDSFIRQTGRIGRSEGCFAVEKSVGDTLINELKDGAYIIASKNQ
jgi:hypothetical protein